MFIQEKNIKFTYVLPLYTVSTKFSIILNKSYFFNTIHIMKRWWDSQFPMTCLVQHMWHFRVKMCRCCTINTIWFHKIFYNCWSTSLHIYYTLEHLHIFYGEQKKKRQIILYLNLNLFLFIFNLFNWSFNCILSHHKHNW